MRYKDSMVKVSKLWLANAMIRYNHDTGMYVFTMYDVDIVRCKDKIEAIKCTLKWINDNIG